MLDIYMALTLLLVAWIWWMTFNDWANRTYGLELEAQRLMKGWPPQKTDWKMPLMFTAVAVVVMIAGLLPDPLPPH